jgi:hypothetical protein
MDLMWNSNHKKRVEVNSKKYNGRINNSMMYRAQYGSAVQIRELKVIKSDGHG